MSENKIGKFGLERIFRDPDMHPVVRDLLVTAAAHVYGATRGDPNEVVSPMALYELLGADNDHTRVMVANIVLVPLREAGLIVECPSQKRAWSGGYRPTDALVWAAEIAPAGAAPELYAAFTDRTLVMAAASGN